MNKKGPSHLQAIVLAALLGWLIAGQRGALTGAIIAVFYDELIAMFGLLGGLLRKTSGFLREEVSLFGDFLRETFLFRFAARCARKWRYYVELGRKTSP